MATASHFCEHTAPGSVVPCSQIATEERHASRHITWNLCSDHAAQWDRGRACPKCGSEESKHEDNGCKPTSRDYTILCTSCGHQWSPNEG